MFTKVKPVKASRESWGQLIRNILILLAIIGGFTFTAFLAAAKFGWLAHPVTRVAVFLIGSILGEWAALVILTWMIRGQHLSLRELGWSQPANYKAYGLSILVFILYSAITATNPKIGPHLLEWSTLKVLALFAALTAGIVEETIFRGYLINMLERMKYRRLIQVLVSSFIFALAHLYSFTSLVSYLITMMETFLLGVAQGTVYLIGKKSLTPVILSHFLIDAVIEPWLLLSFFTG